MKWKKTKQIRQYRNRSLGCLEGVNEFQFGVSLDN